MPIGESVPMPKSLTLDQHVARAHRVDPAGAVGRLASTAPGDTHAADGDGSPSLILRPSPLVSSIARFSMVKSLPYTNSPSGPEISPLKDRMLLSEPAPRTV